MAVATPQGGPGRRRGRGRAYEGGFFGVVCGGDSADGVSLDLKEVLGGVVGDDVQKALFYRVYVGLGVTEESHGRAFHFLSGPASRSQRPLLYISL